MPLCTKARIARDYKALGRTHLKLKDGQEFQLYPHLLALLLRLSSFRADATAEEIARRTKEVLCPLDQQTPQGLEYFLGSAQRAQVTFWPARPFPRAWRLCAFSPPRLAGA